MSTDPFHLNRPVHLARRDVFYNKAVQKIRAIPENKEPAEQRKTAEQALYLLREARRHARSANRSEKTSVQSRLFVDFLDTAVDNTQSIARMLRRQMSVSPKDNALDRFLGGKGTANKMHDHYHRCAAHILKGLLHILQEAETPLHALQQTSLVKMTNTDKARYEKAYSHFEEQADGEAVQAAEAYQEI